MTHSGHYNGSYFVEVTTYHEQNKRKEKDKVGRLAQVGTGWKVTEDENEAYKFKTLDSAKAVRAAWQYEFPEHVAGVVGEQEKGSSFIFHEPGYYHPPTFIDENGRAFYHRSDEPAKKHVRTETCIWCGEEFDPDKLEEHEDECSE